MENLRTQSEKQINKVLLFLAGVCISYSLVKEVILDKPEDGMLLVIGCCLLAANSSTKHK
jgi:hypothetical protein|nr:hypothetical protein [uncultured Flavobacterium sp.]